MNRPLSRFRSFPIALPTGLRRFGRWPLPALVSWCGAWWVHALTLQATQSPLAAVVGASMAGGAVAMWQSTRWRRIIVAGGFPLSAVLTGLLGPLHESLAWLWLIPIMMLSVLYPVGTWGDAPLFPTPADALKALPDVAPLPAGASVLDAGCGLGHGLIALRRAYPRALLNGIEWSAPIARLARWRCGWARVERGDMWLPSWHAHDMVYVFQRPESMARAWAKASEEMRPGSWLVSLEFEVPDRRADAEIRQPGSKPVWLYRIPAQFD